MMISCVLRGLRLACAAVWMGWAGPWLVAQVIAPTIHTVSVDDGDNLRPGAEFVLRFSATAGSMPLERVTIVYTTTTGLARILETTTPQAGTITATVTDDWPAGEYRLQSVSLQSALGTSSFYADATSSPLVPGAIAPPGPSANLFLTRFVVSGSRPYVRPVLSAVVRSGAAEVAAGSTVTFRPTLVAGSSSMRALGLSLRDPNGLLISLSSADPTQVVFQVPAQAVNGKYTVETVSMADVAGQVTAYLRGGQIGGSPGPVVHNVALAAADFTVVNGASTPTFPEMQSFTLGTRNVKVGDTLAIDYALTPGSRPVKSVTFSFTGPVSNPRLTATSSGVTGRATVVVPPSWVSGTYTLNRIDIYDGGDYLTFYQNSGLVGFSPFGVRAAAGHAFSFATTNFSLSDGIVPIPVIVAQPADVSVAPGDPANFSITAYSPAGWQVQWYEGVAGDTRKPVYAGSNAFSVQATTTTAYWARVSNSYGAVDSRTASVTPKFASALPVFSIVPGAISIGVENAIILNPTVVGPGPLTFQWYRDGQPLAGATDVRLNLGLAEAAMAGTYHLVATNPQGSVQSAPIPVVVKDRPRIVTQSQSRTVNVGDRVVIEVVATGGDLTYNWGLPGAFGSTYTIERVEAAFGGQIGFTVYVTNDRGRAIATPIVLTVRDREPPVFTLRAPEIYTTVGEPFGLTIVAANNPLTFTVSSPLPPGAQWNEVGRLLNGAITQAGTYPVTFTVGNSAGSVSQTLTLRVSAQPFAPIFVTQPKSQVAYVDQSVTLVGRVAATVASYDSLSLQWKRDGVVLPFARSETLELSTVRLGDAGSYTLEARTNLGTTVSAPAVLTVLPAVAPPRVVSPPQNQLVAPGGTATFSVVAGSTVPPTYQWSRNGVAIAGATAGTLTLTAVEAPQAGSYTVEITNPGGKVTSPAAALTLNEIVPGHLTNLSVRSFTAAGDRTLIAGFSVVGARSKAMLLRVVGPGLTGFGVQGALNDPKLSLVRGAETVEVNDNWSSSSDNRPVSAAAARLGAFALLSNERDAAAAISLEAGTYSLLGGAASTGSGTVLIELYDADEGFGRVSSRLANVSARSFVGTGADVLITGLVVAGQTPCRLLVRGIGPGLRAFGVGGVLATPRLQIYRGSTVIAENTNWSVQAEEIAGAAQAVGAFALRGTDADTGIVTALPPGSYTVVLSGVNDTTGVGLVEVYALP